MGAFYNRHMVYTLQYAEGEELRRQLKAGLKHALRAGFWLSAAICAALVAAAFAAVVFAVPHLWRMAIVAGVTVAISLCWQWFSILRNALKAWVLPDGASLEVELRESGLRVTAPCIASDSFRVWRVLRLLPLRAGDECLILTDTECGSVLFLPLRGLGEAERRALHTQLAERIAAGRQAAAAGNTPAPLPHPEGFEAGVPCPPAALAEGYDIGIWQLSKRSVMVALAIEAAAALLCVVALWLNAPHRPSMGNLLPVLSLVFLWMGAWMVFRPGRRLWRRQRRFLLENTYSFRTDGSALLRCKASGSWALSPVSLVQQVWQGERCNVLKVGQGTAFTVLPRELPLPAGLPAARPMPRHPWWGWLYALLLLLCTAGSQYFTFTAEPREEEMTEQEMQAQTERFEAFMRAEEARADAAALPEAQAAVQAWLAEWVAADRVEEAACAGEHLTPAQKQLLQNYAERYIAVQIWAERFPVMFTAEWLTLPEPARSELLELTEDLEPFADDEEDDEGL